MNRRVGLVGGFALLILAAAPSSAGAQTAPPQFCSRPFFVVQNFPTAGPTETSWAICWQAMRQYGVVITSAHFRKSPTAPWIRVFWDARVSEIFVPYHPGYPRFLDVAGFSWPVVRLVPQHCPASQGGTLFDVAGSVLKPGGAPGPGVCKQVRDRGLAWSDDQTLRRGQELVLWGALDAANYNYIMEWTFRDDGVVLGRVAPTGVNLPTSRFVTHMHSPTWRLDIDLDGAGRDSVHRGVHTENLPGPTATDTDPLITIEGGLPWNAASFTILKVHDASLRNSRGHASSYHLMPLRYGTGRHQEPFTSHDFWVTRWHPGEMTASDLPTYVTPAEPVSNADVVVWYTASIHHEVRDEDGEEITISGQTFWSGEAHTMWVGWMLKPHNVFDRTPLFP